MWVGGIRAGEERPHVQSIDFFGGQGSVCDVCNRRQQVDAHQQSVTGTASRNAARPRGDAGNPGATFPRGSLPLPHCTGRSRMVPIRQPRAVVGGEQNQGVFLKMKAAERLNNLPHGPVEFLQNISKQAALRLALKLAAHIERDMGHAVRQVEEEWLRPVGFNEPDGPLGVFRGELFLVCGLKVGLEHPGIFHERQGRIRAGPRLGMPGPHIVRVWEAKVRSEPLSRWQELRGVPKMPFAHRSRCIAALLENLGNRGLLRMQPNF